MRDGLDSAQQLSRPPQRLVSQIHHSNILFTLFG
jgi:hypothetical protein